MKIGTPVNVLMDDGTQWRTRTSSEPWEWIDGQWVVALEGQDVFFTELDRVTEAWTDLKAP